MFTQMLVAATLVVGQTPVVPAPPRANVDDAQLLVCGNRSGTVWRISGDRYVTASHVSEVSNCSLGGRPIRVIQSDVALDYAVLSSSRGEGREYEIDCGGFVAGEVYRAIGWARGTDLLALPVAATGETWAGQLGNTTGTYSFHLLRGGAIPGMSGGPVLNRAGKVVGMVNAGSPSTLLSRPMSETPMCDGRI
jgi:hypothetical protein